MKKIKLSFDKFKDSTIYLNSSKSESNRLLIIKALSEKEITIKNLSKANDSVLLKNLLESENLVVWDAQDAGTSFRFLTLIILEIDSALFSNFRFTHLGYGLASY